MTMRSVGITLVLLSLSLAYGCSGNIGHTADSGVSGLGEHCSDQVDNDGDQLIDCVDPDCVNSEECNGRSDGSVDGTYKRYWPICAEASGEAEAIGGGVDIIWFIDTSGSMDIETAWVQQNLDDFATFIGNQQLDYRVILVGEEEICIEPPLGGPGCTDGPRYRHVKEKVGSKDGLIKLIQTYPQWHDFLRPDTAKNFVAVTDDNSSEPASWFDAELANLTDPGFADGYVFHSIVAYGPIEEKGCETGARIGQVYLDLTQQTGGVKFQVCTEDWTPIFSDLAASVAQTARPPCTYVIPDPGGT